MPKIPFLPLAVNDIDMATWRFKLEERGAYDIILNELWRAKGEGIPNDDKWVADLLRVHVRTYRSLKPTLFAEGFLSIKDNRIHQETLNSKYRRITRSSKGLSEGLSEGYKVVEQYENLAENSDKLGVEKNKKSNSNSNSNFNSNIDNSGLFNSFRSGVDDKNFGNLQGAQDEYKRLTKINAFHTVNPIKTLQPIELAKRYNDYISYQKKLDKSFVNIFNWLERKLYLIDYKEDITKKKDLATDRLNKLGITNIKTISSFTGANVFLATLDGSVEILHNDSTVIEYIFKDKKLIEKNKKTRN